MIVAVMIVRNEEKVIERALRSALAVAHQACVCDTGSTDKTMDVARSLYGRDGKLVVIERPWVDYATNRNWAIEWAETVFPQASHLFTVDADDIVKCPNPAKLRLLARSNRKTVFSMEVHHQDQRVLHPRLFPARAGCYYRGVLHEVLATGELRLDYTDLIEIEHTSEGSSWGDEKAKWEAHAVILRRGIRDEPDPAMRDRYQFLLGRALAGAGHPGQAALAYVDRIHRGGNEQEMYCSLLGLATLETDQAYELLEQAAEVAPQRREAWTYLAEFHIKTGHPKLAWPFVLAAMSADSEVGMSIDWAVHEWRADLALAIAAKAVGKDDICKVAEAKVRETAKTHKDRASIEASMRHLDDV